MKQFIKTLSIFLLIVGTVSTCTYSVGENSRVEHHIPLTEIAAVYKSNGYSVAIVDDGVVKFERLPRGLPVVVKLTDDNQYYECDGWYNDFYIESSGQCTIYINSVDDIKPQKWKNGKFGMVENIRIDN